MFEIWYIIAASVFQDNKASVDGFPLEK